MSDVVQTPSGIPLEPVYGPGDRAPDPPPPGEYPFTRGNFASGYRGKTWTFRQYSGFGTAEESNKRYRYLLGQGGTGLSVALDLPTQCGYDSDDAEYGEEVGRVGVAIDTLADVEVLFDSIPLDKISTSFTINGTAAILLAFYVAAAEKTGVPREKLTGTIQNDILKEYASRGTWIWPPEPSLRLIADTIEFCAAEVPRFNAISVAGAHFRDAGANAVQEMAFTLADGVTYCDTVVERGRMTIDKFAPQISFFFYTHGDFFEEIAKYRAGRRRWATIVRERYGAITDKASMFRFGCVAGGASLYAPQAQNNLVRGAYESPAACAAHPPDPRLRNRSGQGGRSARRLLLRRGTDRRHRGQDRRNHGGPRKARRHGAFHRGRLPAGTDRRRSLQDSSRGRVGRTPRGRRQ